MKDRGGIAALSPREREIVALYFEEPEAKMMAQRLGLSTQTVKNHSTRLLHKLGVDRLGQAAILYDRYIRAADWPDRREADRRLAERRQGERRAP